MTQQLKLTNTQKDYLIKKGEHGFFIYLYVAGEKLFDFHLSKDANPKNISISGIRVSELLEEFKIELNNK